MTDGQFLALKNLVDRLVSPRPPEWEVFAALFSQTSLRPEQYFLQAGENSESICFVNTGLLRLFYRTAEGKEMAHAEAFRVITLESDESWEKLKQQRND